MYVYKGVNRRLVGVGLWSTIQCGIRPLILGLLSKLKPHAMELGKSAAKRVAQSALNVGTSVAVDALQGKLNKSRLKSTVDDEMNNLRSSAADKITNLKRRLTQSGSGVVNKRRRKSARANKKKMPKRKRQQYKRKSSTKRKAPKRNKRSAPLRRNKRKSTTKRKVRRTRDIFDRK